MSSFKEKSEELLEQFKQNFANSLSHGIAAALGFFGSLVLVGLSLQ